MDERPSFRSLRDGEAQQSTDGTDQNMYRLESSTLPLSTATAWRSQDVGALAPDPCSPGLLTESVAKRIVACAKKRFDAVQNRGLGTDYANLVVSQPGDLKGLCFVAADEFERFFSDQGYEAKAVRVVPKKGGGDHYFTVINNGTAENSFIVDGTWRQFYSSGYQLNYFLLGTMRNLTAALGGTDTRPSILPMYEAGLKVLKRWNDYTCFK